MQNPIIFSHNITSSHPVTFIGVTHSPGEEITHRAWVPGVGTLGSILEFCPPHWRKPSSASFSYPGAPTLEGTWIRVPQSEASLMTISQRPGLLPNWVILMFADPPTSLNWCPWAFSSLIASIHNHCPRRAKAHRDLEGQAGASRAFSFQCLQSVFQGARRVASSLRGASHHCVQPAITADSGGSLT